MNTIRTLRRLAAQIPVGMLALVAGLGLVVGSLTAAEAAVMGKTPEGNWFDYSRPMGERYDRALEAERAQNRAFAEERPWLSTGTEVAGAIMNPLVRLLPAAGVVKGALGGAAYGGISGFGHGEGGAEERLKESAKGAALGGLVGAGTGALGSKLGKTKITPPTQEALEEGASKSFKAAEDAGIIVSKDSFKQFAESVRQKLADQGVDKTVHPKAMAALNRLLDTKENITLKGIHILRRVARAASRSNDADDRRLGQLIIGEIDNYISGLKDADVVAGDVQVGVSAFKQAMGNWSRVKKSETVLDAIQAARDTAPKLHGSGMENAIRQEFRKLVKNRKMMRTFTPEEQNVLRAVAKGTPVRNLLRWLGVFGPGGGPIGFSLGAGGGAAVGGVPGAIAVPLAGAAARAGSSKMAMNAAENAAGMMRQGGPLVADKSLNRVEQILMRAILAGGAEQAPNVGDDNERQGQR